MIKYIKGDLLDAFDKGDVNIIAHGVNCQGVMGSGISKSVKTRYPLVFKHYYDLVQANKVSSPRSADLLGCSQEIDMCNNKTIVNLFSQDYYSNRDVRNTSYDAIDQGLYLIKRYMQPNEKLGLPKIGAGLGGGDWKIIETIINQTFNDREVYVYELEIKK